MERKQEVHDTTPSEEESVVASVSPEWIVAGGEPRVFLTTSEAARQPDQKSTFQLKLKATADVETTTTSDDELSKPSTPKKREPLTLSVDVTERFLGGMFKAVRVLSTAPHVEVSCRYKTPRAGTAERYIGTARGRAIEAGSLTLYLCDLQYKAAVTGLCNVNVKLIPKPDTEAIQVALASLWLQPGEVVGPSQPPSSATSVHGAGDQPTASHPFFQRPVLPTEDGRGGPSIDYSTRDRAAAVSSSRASGPPASFSADEIVWKLTDRLLDVQKRLVERIELSETRLMSRISALEEKVASLTADATSRASAQEQEGRETEQEAEVEKQEEQ